MTLRCPRQVNSLDKNKKTHTHCRAAVVCIDLAGRARTSTSQNSELASTDGSAVSTPHIVPPFLSLAEARDALFDLPTVVCILLRFGMGAPPFDHEPATRSDNPLRCVALEPFSRLEPDISDSASPAYTG